MLKYQDDVCVRMTSETRIMCVCMTSLLSDSGCELANTGNRGVLEFDPQVLIRRMWAWDSQPCPASHLLFEC